VDLKTRIDPENLPSHIAIIMDGNGRWAKKHARPRIFGHRNGVKAVREVTEAAAEIGIKYLTLYAFSTENWKRPRVEVNALMKLLVETLHKEVATMMENDIKLQAIGDIEKLPKPTYLALLEGINTTKNNQKMTLNLALNYSARWEILEAVKGIVRDIQTTDMEVMDINSELFSQYLSTKKVPDPELLIRTSGENRVSNFLLWQIAYAELYFSPIFWPEFRKKHLYEAILDYQSRERRFGKTSEQLV
jgi:undecaprenyl diphosphate synthase